MSVNEKMTAIADAIRGKTGTTELLTLDDMPTMIEGISTGADIPEENFTLTGNLDRMFCSDGWNWYLEKFGSRIKTKDIESANYMFEDSGVESIPFDFNFSGTQDNVEGLFADAHSLKDIGGKIVNMQPTSMIKMFYQCFELRYLPEFENLDLSFLRMHPRHKGFKNMFNDCLALRHISPSFLKELYTIDVSDESILVSTDYVFSTFYDLFGLDELVGVNPMNCSSENNLFSGFCYHGFRLKDVTFMKNDDGTPISVLWSNQVIDLSNCVGWTDYDYLILQEVGLTTDTQIVDDDSYQRLKHNADSWTVLPEYSRYDKASAIRTLESLPDASQRTNNVIQFRGDAGSKTDGGQIDTMTEEQVAVAVSKGWTVSYSY